MESEENLRIFLGLPIEPQDGDELKDRFLAVSPGPHPDFRWEEPSKYHITIRFMPDFPKASLPMLIQEVAALTLPKLDLPILQVADFPRPGGPFLAANVRLSKELAEIFHKISKILESFGIHPENHSFRPHITLAKIKKNQSNVPLPRVMVKNYEIQIDKLNLYQSALDNSGSRYSVMQSFRLNPVMMI